MSDRHVLDELSDYIDGEAAQPERVARHLRHCATCARRHMELLKLSSHVAALPGPPDNPDLIGRVLAEVGRQQAAADARPGLFPFAPPRRAWAAMALAAALTLAAGLGWMLQSQTGEPASLDTAEAPLLADEAVVVRLVNLLESGGDLAYFEDAQAAPAIEVPADAVPMEVDGLLLTLAAMAASDPEPAYFAVDVFDDVDRLEEAEASIFGQLLDNYFNEG